MRNIFVTCGLVGVTLSVAVAAAAESRIVTPEESDDLLANPGIGWETFHQTCRQDRNLPLWIPSTVQYARWGWRELEPQPGKLNTEFLDRELQAAREAGQKLAFRVMCCSTNLGRPYHPDWLKELGGRELAADFEGQGPLPIPDFDDPVVLARHVDFIQRLGQRYDGHPDLAHVDLGSIGWWGEWHLSGSKTQKLPTRENRRKVVDAYLAAFRRTPRVMLIGGGDCLQYACRHGAGWRADCLGDLGGFSRSWSHMRQGYPDWFRAAGLEDVWKTAPVAWETCWDLRKWVDEGWSLRSIFNYALACHASVVNNKSAPLPRRGDVQPELERFLKRLGYRLVLRQLKHDAAVRAGGKLSLAMTWQNAGSAPCYQPYKLAYRLRNAHGVAKIVIGNVTVERWLPGSVELFTPEFLRNPPDLPGGAPVAVSDAIDVPGDLPPGDYELALAVVDPVSGAPRVKLAIRGRAEGDWYPLSTVRVER